ncbi:MAG: M50 family metallopeptidase [Pseudomonadota bacterium]
MHQRSFGEASASSHSPSGLPGRTGLVWLIAAALVTVILWQLPFGNYILYPFTILATWFHEMAHGIAALILGGGFTKLLIFPDGSGLAYYSGPLFLEPISQALVAAAGPIGPPLAGAALIIASRTTQSASVALKILAVLLLVSTAVWVRSLFGIIAIPALGLLTLFISLKASARTRVFAVQFLGVQACVSTYLQVGYLFSHSAGSLGLSDTARIQQVLLLPYWFWGALIAASSFLILVRSLRIAYGSGPLLRIRDSSGT